MKKEKKAITVLILFVAMVLALQGMVKAGNLEPPAPPGATMHSLDDIYNNTTKTSTLPKPEEVTIITKTAQFTNSTTLHTVTLGKTFYLMGVNASCQTAGLGSANGINLISVQGANTTNFLNLYLTNPNNTAPVSIVSSYPIASVSSGTVIRGEPITPEAVFFITIWGYEK